MVGVISRPGGSLTPMAEWLLPAGPIRAAQDLAMRIGQLLAADDPAEGEALSRYVDRALRRVQIEVEELLAEAESGRPGTMARC